MNIVMMNPKDLIPYEGNPKDHPKEQIDAIAHSISTFGFDQPIVVDKKNVIIKGHGRCLAALKLKLKSVPVIVSETSEANATLGRVLDNYLTSKDYDTPSLREELMALKESGNLGLTLFSESMIPDVHLMVPSGEATILSLMTTHKCDSCGYRW